MIPGSILVIQNMKTQAGKKKKKILFHRKYRRWKNDISEVKFKKMFMVTDLESGCDTPQKWYISCYKQGQTFTVCWRIQIITEV